jgi:hypothetical protein
VACAEQGYLELLLLRAELGSRVKMRCLAWEGDTVFEQPRMLNYPPLEKQLDDIGATVVLAQFGQMESRAGETKLADFTAAYAKLIERLKGGGKRRVVLITPAVDPTDPVAREYERAVGGVRTLTVFISGVLGGYTKVPLRQPDGLHLTDAGQSRIANAIAAQLLVQQIAGPGPGPDMEMRLPKMVRLPDDGGPVAAPAEEALRQLIIAKNRLWTNFYRPQNWAFLAGDRVTQPSSRDHVDPSKRWFPEEMEKWKPLIAAKEEEIWKQAAELGAKVK